MGSASKIVSGLAMLLLAASVQAQPQAGPEVRIVSRSVEDTPPVPYDAGAYRLLVPSESQDGRFAVIELVEGPGYQTPWHRHEAMEERYYVAEGTLTVSSAEGTRDYPAGSYITIPPGAAHAQGNRTAEPVRLLLTVTPGGFEQFFIDRAELHKTVQRGDPGFQDEMVKIAMRHGRWLQPAEAPAAAATP